MLQFWYSPIKGVYSVFLDYSHHRGETCPVSDVIVTCVNLIDLEGDYSLHSLYDLQILVETGQQGHSNLQVTDEMITETTKTMEKMRQTTGPYHRYGSKASLPAQKTS